MVLITCFGSKGAYTSDDRGETLLSPFAPNPLVPHGQYPGWYLDTKAQQGCYPLLPVAKNHPENQDIPMTECFDRVLNPQDCALSSTSSGVSTDVESGFGQHRLLSFPLEC